MICPACAHTHFQPTRIEGGLPAERCDACGGVLVELERYRAWRKAMPEMALAAAAWEPSVTDGAVRLCPKTGRLMTRLKVDSQHPLRLDYSAAAGQSGSTPASGTPWCRSASMASSMKSPPTAGRPACRRPHRASASSRPCRRASATTRPSWPASAHWLDGQPNRREMLAFLGAPKD